MHVETEEEIKENELPVGKGCAIAILFGTVFWAGIALLIWWLLL